MDEFAAVFAFLMIGDGAAGGGDTFPGMAASYGIVPVV
jgi:hypothetical protein